jgi:hypothetical protein
MNHRLFFILFKSGAYYAIGGAVYVAYIERRFIFFELISVFKISTIRASPS